MKGRAQHTVAASQLRCIKYIKSSVVGSGAISAKPSVVFSKGRGDAHNQERGAGDDREHHRRCFVDDRLRFSRFPQHLPH